MKYFFYLILMITLYRLIFGQKVIVEHRIKDERRRRKPADQKPLSQKGEYTDYEEIK